ncbi:hypothetical protein M409DRAFT_18794 [Zasmidium cellare ATCC 36951]|uniref:Uncharacterized protein n=1 Tax=Zasmidium cellare ATCC 36951 TaxID=1080233 RepID=A0A6A6CUP2_ZASCE|nr:uncharacterized protein M409DRAFT_18794 [Zasmidium cellare ATCC 36951]KAF2170821.1 hypothetical protein M409DRAFT_18794 [Zasmidium cellare ATCC 36951]
MAGAIFHTPPTFVPAYSPRDDARRAHQNQHQHQDLLIDTSVPPIPTHNNSALAAHRNPRSIRTRSLPFGAGVVFERDLPAPSDDDIIIVTVRLQNPFRRSSIEGAESLPSRPPPRSFLRRLSTRMNIDHSAEKEERYKAIKMPRREYKKYFARDKEGNYAGTEEERGWDEEELTRCYGEYQNVPLHSILC